MNIRPYIKQGVVGYGRADKMQAQQMVKTLNLPEVPRPDDAARCIGSSNLSCAHWEFKDMFKIKQVLGTANV